MALDSGALPVVMDPLGPPSHAAMMSSGTDAPPSPTLPPPPPRHCPQNHIRPRGTPLQNTPKCVKPEARTSTPTPPPVVPHTRVEAL